MGRTKDLKKEFKHSKQETARATLFVSILVVVSWLWSALSTYTCAVSSFLVGFFSFGIAVHFIKEWYQYMRHDAFETFALKKLTKEKERLVKKQKLKELQVELDGQK